MVKVKRALTIAGSDSCCGAGIQSDIKTFAEFNVYAASVITAVTSQNISRISEIHHIPSHSIASQIDAVLESTKIGAAKIGMLGTSEAIDTVADKLRNYNIKHVVLDPVIKSSTGFSLLCDDALELLKCRLMPLSFLVTPNIYEAEQLSGLHITGLKTMKEAAKSIYQYGVQNVLIKGGHLHDEPVDILYNGKRFYTFTTERINRETHGTGCMFSAAITAELVKGNRLNGAIGYAKNYIYNILANQINSAGKRHRIITELQEAIDMLKHFRIGKLIPEVQSNIAYALTEANGPEDIAAVPGRIIKLNDDIYTLMPPDFGCSRHISKVVLTVMKYDRNRRAAMNIKYSREIISICKSLKLKTAGFDRSKEPEKIREEEGYSLEWGTEYAIKKAGLVPDIIYDRGGIGKEPIIRIIANNPMGVVRIIKKIVRAS